MLTAEASHAVVTEKLERRFGQFVAVRDLDLRVRSGEVFGFLGPNGAGKSTTIRMLCGLLAPSGGSGRVAGFDMRTQPELIKQHIGYMSQKFSLYADLTVEENIDFFSGIYTIPRARKLERKEWVLDMAGLTAHRHTRTQLLSGGWKQRLALGCAVLHQPPILFLDEPTSGVDALSRRRFWDLIYDMAAQGVTVFITTHYMDEAEYCDRLALIYRGEKIAEGTPLELKTHAMQERVLEVSCLDGQAALEGIARLPGIKDVALFGRHLHVRVEDVQLATRTLRSFFDAQNQPAAHFEAVVPSFEDVFVSLIEARDRTDAPQSQVPA